MAKTGTLLIEPPANPVAKRVRSVSKQTVALMRIAAEYPNQVPVATPVALPAAELSARAR